MKKLLFLIVAMLVSFAIMAQGSKETFTAKSFLAFHAGPSFPVGDFGKTNLISNGTNEIYNGEAGFANTGYNLNLNYGYQFIKNVGLSASALYNSNKLNHDAIINQLDAIMEGEIVDPDLVKFDHWQWYGLTVGPMINHELVNNFTVDVKVMGGIANVNSPRVKYQNIELVKEDWAVAPLIQTGVDLRIGFGNNMFVLVNADYLYMKPKFTMSYDIDGEVWTETAKQKMSVINVTGGIGIRF
jgi:hypothetical protein